MSWSPASGPLRQGDICVIPAFPIWDIKRATRQVGSNDVTESLGLPRHRTIEWDSLSGAVPVAICSHDCDLENPRDRTGIIIAPLIRVPASPTDPRFEEIMASGVIGREVHYTHLFPISYVGQSDETVNAVIDFSALTSMAKAEAAIQKLQPSKVLECDDETRQAIRTKIALFLARPNQAPRG